MHEWRWFRQKQRRKPRCAQLSRRGRHSLLASCRGPKLVLLPAVDRVLRDEFPGIEIRLSSDYSPVLAKALMRRKLDAAFIRPEEQMGDLSYRRVRVDPLFLFFRATTG
jgi:LysR substrate binding domain.